MESVKNIVVLKNLPSNIVEEAIVVLKQNEKSKIMEHIDKKTYEDIENKKDKFDMCIRKEAEMVISEYISAIERGNKNKEYQKLLEKNKKFKKTNLILGIILTISLVLNII